MKKYFSKACDDLLELSLWFSKKNKQFETWLKEKEKNSFISFILGIITPSHVVSKNIVEDLTEPLNYEQEEKSRGTKCYLILFSPLIIISIISIITTVFSYIFLKNTILFFDEYVKLIPLIIPFIILFTWIIPALFFKLFFSKNKKNISLYTYGIFVAIILPLLIIPQNYHHYFGKSIKITGTVQNIDNYRKNRHIVFLTNEVKLRKAKISHLSKDILENAKIGEKYIITGKKSKFYFTYKEVKKSVH